MNIDFGDFLGEDEAFEDELRGEKVGEADVNKVAANNGMKSS